jgi:hypothetical protein
MSRRNADETRRTIARNKSGVTTIEEVMPVVCRFHNFGTLSGQFKSDQVDALAIYKKKSARQPIVPLGGVQTTATRSFP